MTQRVSQEATGQVSPEAVEKHAEALALRDGRWGGRLVPTFYQMDGVDRDAYLAQARRDLQAAYDIDVPRLRGQLEAEVRERLARECDRRIDALEEQSPERSVSYRRGGAHALHNFRVYLRTPTTQEPSPPPPPPPAFYDEDDDPNALAEAEREMREESLGELRTEMEIEAAQEGDDRG